MRAVAPQTSSAARFDQEVSSLIDTLDIPARQDEDDISKLFRSWLDDDRRQ